MNNVPAPKCSVGVCNGACASGHADCDNDKLTNGCETMLGTNADCAFCGDECKLPNSNSQCMSAACTLVACNAGYSNCDAIAGNGCEVDSATDPNHCGSCGNVCPYGPHSTPVCNNSVCAIVCDPGYADCDKNPNNGCEVDIDNNPNNCGACGTICSPANATGACVAGKCTIVLCNTGYADCNHQYADGCEINVSNDSRNCGSCGTQCGALMSCVAAQCQ
jgi:hypothetical protein